LIGWLRPWQSEQAVPALAPVAVQPLAASPRPAASPPIPVLPENFAEPGHETLVQKPTPAKQAANPSGNAEVTANTPESSKTKMPTDKAFVTDPAHTEPEHRVTDITELPPSLQQEIPNLSISLHSYVSAPKDRLVMINNTLLRQGEFLAPGLRLEQITSDGVVISYKNYQFHRGVR
jgi:general secretion pathway protein B